MRAPARELFQDAAFPASDSSLFSSFSTPLARFREDITWKRPQEICAAPRMFPDNPQEGQVKQGLLGDCWFLCACAALQKSRHLLDQVVPPGQPSWLDEMYRGSFACRVWQFGRWVEVTVDDRLPCLAGRLCFSRCQRADVFWLPLLEKAYAKYAGRKPGWGAGATGHPRPGCPQAAAPCHFQASGGRSRVRNSGSWPAVAPLPAPVAQLGVKSGPVFSSFLCPQTPAGENFSPIWSSPLGTGGLLQAAGGKGGPGRQPRPWQPSPSLGRSLDRGSSLEGALAAASLTTGPSVPARGSAGGQRQQDPAGTLHGSRVHGSYEHLWAGQVADALVDLTGGLAERWSLKGLARSSGPPDGPGGPEPRTCRQLLSLKQRCPISCSVFSPRAGARELGEFHAFIVSDLRELRGRAGQRILLLRIQNPWGRRCWRGPWREGGEGWSQADPGAQQALLSQLQEGEFWVEEEEFLREFDEVTVGYPVTESGHLQSLHSEKVLSHRRELPGAWVQGQSAGGCRNYSSFPSNPKFWLRVSEPSEVCVAVLQRPRGCPAGWAGRAPAGDDHTAWSLASAPGRDYPAVGLHLWKVEKRRVSLPRVLSAPPVAGTACHAYDREVHLRCELAPGYYLVVPSTFLKGVPGQFLLRVFSSGSVSLSAIKTVARSPGPGAALSAGEWATVQLRGSWRAGQTAGGSRNFASFPSNPCLPLSVPGGAGPRCVRISLRQHRPDGDCHAIGFHVFQAPAEGGGQGATPLLLQKPLVSCVPHRHAQEVSRVCHLSAGTYRVVPSTYLPDLEGAFTVTIATRIDRHSIHSQEMLGQPLQEASFRAVMKT